MLYAMRRVDTFQEIEAVWPLTVQRGVMPDNPKLREVYVTLRLGNEDLDPEDVTQRLGIMPSHAHRRGDLSGRLSRLPYRSGQWSLTSEGQPIPRDLEDHIAWVLDQIEPVREQFMALRVSARLADIFCYLYCYGAGGPELSAELMGRLAALRLPVGLDIYFADEEEDENPGASQLT